ncbi:ferritin-like domain-containing protein [Streptomyces lienomycini]
MSRTRTSHTRQAHYHHTPDSRTRDGRFAHVVVVTLTDQGLTTAEEPTIVRCMTSSDKPGTAAAAPSDSAENAGNAGATSIAARDWSSAAADPQYRAAVVDLLGALAYGELAAFERLAEDAKLAPTLADKAELAKMASAEFHHFERLRDRLAEVGEEPTGAMEPFVAAYDGFHKQTDPSDWLEGLVKAYVGDSIASDFYREVAARLDTDTRELVLAVLDDTGHAEFAVEKVRAAIDADPRVGGRLALWARRLMGEALSQSQRVVADRDALSTMLVGGVADGFDLAEVGRMFSRITEAHTKRMAALGLAA